MAVPPIWKLEHHTAAKHEILRRYLGAWFPILTLGGFNRRVLFLDGFAGPGIYSKGEKGSPIIALETLATHQLFPKLANTEFLFLFVEKDKTRHASLIEQIDLCWDRLGGQPQNIKVHAIQAEFAEIATDLVDTMREQKKNLAPTFAFIDPFGWSGVALSTICELVSFDKCEVFFNFMYDHLNRFIKHPEDWVHGHLEELFGTGEYREADGLPPEDRRAFLHGLYREQLERVGKFKYVRSFEMINKQGHNTYSLFFGTRSIDGLRVMKDAMWAVDPVGGLRFSDRLAGENVLFGDEPDYAPLRKALRETFDGQDVPIETVEHFVVVETPYKLGGLKRDVLRPMQLVDERLVGVDQKRAGQFPAGTVIRFV